MKHLSAFITLTFVTSLSLPFVVFGEETVPVPIQAISSFQENEGVSPLPPKGERPLPKKEFREAVIEKRQLIASTTKKTAPYSTDKRPPVGIMASGTKKEMLATKAVGNDFCSNIDKILVVIDQKKENEPKRVAQPKKESGGEKQGELATFRDDQDTKEKEQLANLNKKVTTEPQKFAVETFGKTMETLLKEKRTAVDAILLSYKNEMESSLSGKESAKASALAMLQEEVESAKTQAKNDCANNVPGNQVRETLKKRIEEAHKTMREKNTSLKDKALLEIKENRKKEIEKVEEQFKKKMEEAKQILKTSLKNSQ